MWVDRWIIGALNYMGVDGKVYAGDVREVEKYVEENGLRVIWKKELRPYLAAADLKSLSY